MESTATFQALLQDKQNTKSFLYFLQLEFGEENLAFYLDVEDFKQTLDVDKAKKIIDEYIKPYSEKEVNISYKTKCAVATRIESMLHIHLGFRDPSIENGRESISTRDRRPSTVTGPPMGILAATEAGGLADLFREAQDEVFQLLFLGPFQRYKSREDTNAANSHILNPEQVYDLCTQSDGWLQLQANKKDGSKTHVYSNLQKNLFYLKGSILISNSHTNITEYLLDVDHQVDYDVNVQSAAVEKNAAGVDIIRTRLKDGRETRSERYVHTLKGDVNVIARKDELYQYFIISPCDAKGAVSYLYYVFEFDISTDELEYEDKAKEVLAMLKFIKQNAEPKKRSFFSRKKSSTISTPQPAKSSFFFRRGLRPKSTTYASPPTTSPALLQPSSSTSALPGPKSSSASSSSSLSVTPNRDSAAFPATLPTAVKQSKRFSLKLLLSPQRN